MKNWISVAAIVFALAGAATPGEGGDVPISDFVWPRIVESIEMTCDSVDISYSGSNYATGPISATLDPDRISTFVTDFRDGSAVIDLYLLVDFPLLQSLGVPPQKVRVVEVAVPGSVEVEPAMISETDWTEITVTYAGTFAGSGVFEPGQLFSGWIYENCSGCEPAKAPVRPKKPVDPNNIRRHIEEIERLTQPGRYEQGAMRIWSPEGQAYTLTGVTFTIHTVPVPEPSASALVALGIGVTRLLTLLRRDRL